jgi:hypothetical protein
MVRNLIPLPYRRVSVQRVGIPLDEASVRQYLLGKEAYRWTDYVVLCAQEGQAIARVEKVDRGPLFSPIVTVELVASPESCVYVVDPEVDTGNPSAMAAKAAALGISAEQTLIVEGLYGHVNFLYHPDPLVVRVVDVVPPRPAKLTSLVRQVLSYADLPPILVQEELIDLSQLAHQHPAPAHLFPCRASGLEGPRVTYYLEERPPRTEWVLIGCQRSREIHRHFYGDEPTWLEMCPPLLVEDDGRPTMVKCCLLEEEVAVEGQRVVVPWGATLAQVEQGLRALCASLGLIPTGQATATHDLRPSVRGGAR